MSRPPDLLGLAVSPLMLLDHHHQSQPHDQRGEEYVPIVSVHITTFMCSGREGKRERERLHNTYQTTNQGGGGEVYLIVIPQIFFVGRKRPG